jgi:hypothetical protein
VNESINQLKISLNSSKNTIKFSLNPDLSFPTISKGKK